MEKFKIITNATYFQTHLNDLGFLFFYAKKKGKIIRYFVVRKEAK